MITRYFRTDVPGGHVSYYKIKFENGIARHCVKIDLEDNPQIDLNYPAQNIGDLMYWDESKDTKSISEQTFVLQLLISSGLIE